MRRRTIFGGLLGAAVLSSGSYGQPAAGAVKTQLAPGGRLRVAINYGNAVLARRDPAGGALSGVSVDLARELGRRLDLTPELVGFDAAGKVSAAATHDLWDVAFLAIDPERARDISFTAAYVVIEGSYVVRQNSPLQTGDEVDRDGIRVAVSARSAYDLFLTRVLKHAQILRAGSTPEAVALFRKERLEVMAGVKQALQPLVAEDPDLRMLPGRFMEIDQAMGMQPGRPEAAAYLHAFVEDVKASGFVAAALKRNGQADATVAPPG